MRDCILTYYLVVLGAPLPEEWRGAGGTVSEIARALRLNANQHRLVLNVVVKTHHALLTGAKYDSMRKFFASSAAIKSGSPEEQAIANYRECALSYIDTMPLIIRQCLQDGRPTVTRSAVRTCKLNMVREVDAIEKRPQGNKDANSNWAKTRHRFVVQMLVRLGAEPDLDEFWLADGSVLACFDREKLTPMYEDGIAW